MQKTIRFVKKSELEFYAEGDAMVVPCSKCRAPLEEESFAGGQSVLCPGCGSILRIDAFPALKYLSPDFSESPSEKNGGEANCFFHGSKRAEVSCSSCGRFLCALCDMEIEGRHICPLCLETGKRKRKLVNLENERTLYDRIALSTAVLPAILIWPTILTAPVAVYIAIKFWNAPGSLLGKKRWKFVAAIGIASLQICGWLFVLSLIVTEF